MVSQVNPPSNSLPNQEDYGKTHVFYENDRFLKRDRKPVIVSNEVNHSSSPLPDEEDFKKTHVFYEPGRFSKINRRAFRLSNEVNPPSNPLRHKEDYRKTHVFVDNDRLLKRDRKPVPVCIETKKDNKSEEKTVQKAFTLKLKLKNSKLKNEA